MLSRPGEVRLRKQNKAGFVPEIIQVVQKRKKEKKENPHQNAKTKNKTLNINVIALMRHTEQITQCQK